MSDTRGANDGSVTENATTLRVHVIGSAAASRVRVEQRGFRTDQQALLPYRASSWACTLALLKAYVEGNWRLPRQTTTVVVPVEPNPQAFASATGSAQAIAQWSGQPASLLLAATPHVASVRIAPNDTHSVSTKGGCVVPVNIARHVEILRQSR